MPQSDFNLEHQNQSLDSKIVAILERLGQAFRVLLWQESKEFSLSPIQVQLLVFLLYHSAEKCRVGYLADEFNMTKATISDSVKVLEQKGLINKEYQQHDARSYLIQLTREGREIATSAAMFSTEVRKPFEKMDERDKQVVLASLLEAVRYLNQKGIITIQRMCQTCRYYTKDHAGEAHYCSLLNQPLRSSDHRIDCPEHELIAD